jgi:hypothetical protein
MESGNCFSKTFCHNNDNIVSSPSARHGRRKCPLPTILLCAIISKKGAVKFQ